MGKYSYCILTALALSLCANVFILTLLDKSRTGRELDVFGDFPVELKQRQTVMVIDSLLLQINIYASLTGRVPESTDLLQAPLDGDGPGWPLDRFGNKLEYRTTTNEVMLISAGVDGIFGTEDDILGRLSADGLSREIESPVGTWSAETLCCEGIRSEAAPRTKGK